MIELAKETVERVIKWSMYVSAKCDIGCLDYRYRTKPSVMECLEKTPVP